MESLLPPPPLLPNPRDHFLLAPGLTFLNHGSFGAMPRVVFDAQNQWRQRIEADPIELLGRRSAELIAAAKQSIGRWLGMAPADFGLVTNATEGINCVLSSLTLSPGDELLTTSHVYNAVRQAMKFTAARTGAVYKEIEFPLPIDSPQLIESAVMAAVTARTKLLVIDHITSPTALVFPVERILAACDSLGLDVLVDGAHAPGMVPLDVTRLAPAYYAGNLHKWACGPKGSAFIYVRKDRQPNVHPMTISHHLGQGMIKEFSWQGTRDISAWLATPRAIEFMADIGWDRIMSHNHALAAWVHQMLCRRWNLPPLSPLDGSMLGSMATVVLPPPLDLLPEDQLDAVQRRLHDQYRVEVPIMRWSNRNWLRLCCQIYNVPQEYEQMAQAIESIAS